MRCAHKMLGFGCSNEAEPGKALCAGCHAIVFGPMYKDPIVRRILAFVVLAAFAIIACSVLAQEKPPQLSADSRISLLKLQLKQKQLESQFLGLQQQVTTMQQQMTKLQGDYTEGGMALQNAIDAAYKDAKLDKKEWNLNLDTLEFTKVPAPPPKPEEPKKP